MRAGEREREREREKENGRRPRVPVRPARARMRHEGWDGVIPPLRHPSPQTPSSRQGPRRPCARACFAPRNHARKASSRLTCQEAVPFTPLPSLPRCSPSAQPRRRQANQPPRGFQDGFPPPFPEPRGTRAAAAAARALRFLGACPRPHPGASTQAPSSALPKLPTRPQGGLIGRPPSQKSAGERRQKPTHVDWLWPSLLALVQVAVTWLPAKPREGQRGEEESNTPAKER